MRKPLIQYAIFAAVLGAGFIVYTALKPSFWDTGAPLLAGSGSISLLDDLDAASPSSGWKERTFFRIAPTTYRNTQEDGLPALRCTTDNSGSILARDTDIALSDLPILSWQWKVTQPIKSTVDEGVEDGDDHPLRFYLRFSNEAGDITGAEIIWSNQKYAPGDFKIIGSFYHLVVNGLDQNVGVWHDQTVDLRQLYTDIGGTGIPRLQVIGFFCDSDNTGVQSDGFFRDVILSSGG